jgi:hypothetical protein
MNRHLAVGAALACVVLSSGCSRHVTDFTVLSTKDAIAESAPQGKKVSGEDCVPVILVHWGEPNLNQAIDRAIESAGPGYDTLVDGVVSRRYEYFLFGQECWQVDGTAVPRETSALR